MFDKPDKIYYSSNPKFLNTTFFVEEKMGILTLNIITIPIVEQESWIVNNPTISISILMKFVIACSLIELN